MALFRRGASGGMPGAVAYGWRYLAADGADVTEQLLRPGVETVTAEAVQAGTGTILLTVRKTGHGWQATGGHLYQAAASVAVVQFHGSPFDAFAYVVRCLGLLPPVEA